MDNLITVNFRQETLFAVEREDGVFVAVKPISDCLGLAWQSQLHRIKNDPVLSEGVTTIVMPSTGGAQETTCLKLDRVNGWLCKIDARRVKDEAREKLIMYQRECYQVLFEHFYGKAMAKSTAVPVEQEANESEGLKLRHITECRHVFGHQAAGQLWFQLGLPVVPAMLHDQRQLSIFDYDQIKSVEAGA